MIELQTLLAHVRLLVGVDPRFGIHRLVKAKGRWSGLLRQEFGWLRSWSPTVWTNSHLVASVSGASLSVIKRYVDNQKSR